MTSDLDIEHGARARPVPDAPVKALLGRAEELAKRWAITLMLARPLQALGDIPLKDLASGAPALCAQVVRALDSDAELERIAAGDGAGGGDGATPALRLNELAGARDARAAVQAVEALRGVLWEALLGELRDPPARLVADLSDRLAFVCAMALAANLAIDAPLTRERAVRSERSAHEQIVYSSPRSSSGRLEAVLVDEHADAPPDSSPVRTRVWRHESAVDESAVAPPIGGVGSSGVSACDHRAARSDFELRPAAGRPRPWDTPPRADAPRGRPSTEEFARRPSTPEPSKPESSSEPVMRLTRRPAAPADEHG
jgi:hypothetical protein